MCVMWDVCVHAVWCVCVLWGCVSVCVCVWGVHACGVCTSCVFGVCTSCVCGVCVVCVDISAGREPLLWPKVRFCTKLSLTAENK